MADLAAHRKTIRANHLRSEEHVLETLAQTASLGAAQHTAIKTRAIGLIEAIRADDRPGMMEVFLAEYGLSTDEGIALMCLAEALLRVPDAETMDALIEDKIAPSDWNRHLGKSTSSLVNASTWALLLTGKVLQDGTGTTAILRSAVKRLGEPVIRTAVSRAMKELGAQFVLGETIDEALRRGTSRAARGYTFSYDMLGEAALTAHDAEHFMTAYKNAIERLARECHSSDVRENPGISIKLSALHPRYEVGQRARVMDELVPRTLELALQARAAGMGLNIDAEEADRLDLSLDIIEAVLADDRLAGWEGFGVVVQAYGKRASSVIDWLHALATKLNRRIMVRLVKGAYWDTEIKRAQVEGLPGFPVFTTKPATDVSYIACAAQLLRLTDRIYPQFATHNAHSVAAVLEMATDIQAFEFQRLHGMGASLHDTVITNSGTRCRIYAPVGPHRDLLAYLVRRLLENGANSSFVNQIVDTDVPADHIAADPFETVKTTHKVVLDPSDLYAPERANSKGLDLHNTDDLAAIEGAMAPFKSATWSAVPIVVGGAQDADALPVVNPADPADIVGHVQEADAATVEAAIAAAKPWAADADTRASVLNQAADLYEQNFGELFAILTREAGKTAKDAISELREAVDFLRYYAVRGQELSQGPRGTFACISPWNFPLAIFTGQIAGALAAANSVIAKPAEQTPLTADLAVRLLHQAGVPLHALQLLPGQGGVVGAALSGDPRIAGLCFTGSTETAQRINRAMASSGNPEAPFVAETGGLNAMIVDSTALPEQAVRDILASSFQSAGQRCSALRVLYLQNDIRAPFLKMLFGAMDELRVGDPWDFASDLGPVIDAEAASQIIAHITAAASEGRVLHQVPAPSAGIFVSPTVIEVSSISDLEREIFGPVLHIAGFEADELDDVVQAINATGFGLTFGMHSRIDDRVDQVTRALRVGNIYINRNQIGAVVGSQPFGGEGLSGTGPKAGGPRYVARMSASARKRHALAGGRAIEEQEAHAAIDAARTALIQAPTSISLPGPTGESNRLSDMGRGVVLCLGPTADDARAQAATVSRAGAIPVAIAPGLAKGEGVDGVLDRALLARLDGIDAVALWSQSEDLRAARMALASRGGTIIGLFTELDLQDRCRIERHVCIDTTAAGGNAKLLAQAS